MLRRQLEHPHRMAGTALVLLASCSNRVGAPRAGTEQAESVLDLWRILFWVAAVLGAIVLGLIAWCVVRYRSRNTADGELPAQTRGNVPVEVIYTAIPLVIAAVLFGLSLRTNETTTKVHRQAGFDRLEVEVTGYQWQWRFEYPEENVVVEAEPGELPVLVLPVGLPVQLRLRSTDVIHSFFVPGFLTKRDVIPGVENEIELRPVRTGTYGGHCAEFCGLDHARMNFTVEVVSPERFGEWVASRRQMAAASP